MANISLKFNEVPIEDRDIETSFVIRDGSLFLEWTVEKEVYNSRKGALKDSTLITIYDLGYLNYSEDNKEIIINGSFSSLYVEANYFKNMAKNYFNSYASNTREIKEKYITPYNSVSKKHQKLIKENRKYEKMIDFYTEGYLMNTKKEFLSEDEDKFFAKFDLRGKGIGGKTINKNILEMLREFPRTNKQVTVWRAVRMKKPPKEGEIINQDIVFSTSLNPYISMDFMDKCCLFKIVLPPRYPVLFINKFLEWQDEVILGPAEITIEKIDIVKKRDVNKFLGDPIFPHLRTYGTYMKRSSKKIYIYDCSIKLEDE